jgi:hypothetical protein
MSINEFEQFWSARGAEVTPSKHIADSCHYFVRSWELSDMRPDPFGELVRRSGVNQPISMVFTRKEIEGMTLLDLEEQCVARQLEVTFGA